MSEIVPKLGTYIEVIAKVTESITGISANDTGNVQIYDTPEKLTFSSSMSSHFKPGLDYPIIVSRRFKVTDRNTLNDMMSRSPTSLMSFFCDVSLFRNCYVCSRCSFASQVIHALQVTTEYEKTEIHSIVQIDR